MLCQVGVLYQVVLVRGVAEHVRALRGNGSQLDCQRVLAAGGLVVRQRRARAARPVPVAASGADVPVRQVEPQVLAVPALLAHPICRVGRNLPALRVQLDEVLRVLADHQRLLLPRCHLLLVQGPRVGYRGVASLDNDLGKVCVRQGDEQLLRHHHQRMNLGNVKLRLSLKATIHPNCKLGWFRLLSNNACFGYLGVCKVKVQYCTRLRVIKRQMPVRVRAHCGHVEEQACGREWCIVAERTLFLKYVFV
mmetsp:Transcript_45271/g.86577  ORF Transcript_45271/g.86577 Transcript_45271/m.86577 type:complete len:250 (-) Transcript_45271:115-864(-)